MLVPNVDYINSKTSFRYFHEKILGLSYPIFDSNLSFIATDDNMLSVALWLAYFNKNYSIVIDGIKMPDVEEFHEIVHNINKKLIPHYLSISGSPNLYFYNKTKVQLETGSVILFNHKKLILPAVKGMSITSIISNRKLSYADTFKKCILPTLYGRYSIHLIEPEPQVDTLFAIRAALDAPEIEFGLDMICNIGSSPELILTMSMESIEVHREILNSTLMISKFNNTDIEDMIRCISNHIEYKLKKLCL